MPVLFEWYKFVASVGFVFANLVQDSPAVRNDITHRDYVVLTGLLNRCSRLMLANVALSHEGKFGESTSILDRCIFESCVILSWLLINTNDDRFDRCFASGFKTELELKDQIMQAVEERGGEHLSIEDRMLNSIDNHFVEVGFDDELVRATPGLPDMAAMLDFLGHQRLSYTVGQRIGSHFVHGTWVGLRMHYLQKQDDGTFQPTNNVEPHVNQFVFIPFIVIDTIKDFITFIFQGVEEEQEAMIGMMDGIIEEIQNVNQEIVGADFHVAEGEH